MTLFGLFALSGIDDTARAHTHINQDEPDGYILECPDKHRSGGHYRVIEGESFRVTLYTDRGIGDLSQMDATFSATRYPSGDSQLFAGREVSGGYGKERAGIDIPTYHDTDDDDFEFFVRAYQRIGTDNRTTLRCTIQILDDEAYPWERLDTTSRDAGGSSSTRKWLDTYNDETFAFLGVLNRSDDRHDYYAFWLNRRTEFVVEFHKQHSSSHPGAMQVWSRNGGVRGSVAPGETRTFTLQTGIHELRVSMDSGTATERNYEHYTVLAKAWIDDGSAAKATDLGTLEEETRTISGLINSDDDEFDFYKFTLDRRSRILLSDVRSSELQLWNAAQELVDISVDNDDSATEDLDAGTYYLRVEAPSAAIARRPASYESTITVSVPKPVITNVSVTSRPRVGDTYGWGETIEVQVTFDREVVVSGTPLVSLTVGGVWRGARCTGGSGTKVLTCHYQVVEDDTDTDGISIHASNSAGSHGLVGTGSSITDSEFGSTANRAYSAQSNLSGHKVAGRPSGDANLSALELSDGTNPIALHQTFDAQTTAYTAEAGNTVGTITVTPTTNDDYATVAYLDAANAVLADTDTTTEHHQVALDVWANTIKVRVTAENMTTTKTYTVRVTRVPANLDAPTNLVAVPVSETRVHLYWGAPPNAALGGLTGYEYRMSTDEGHTWIRPWRDIPGAGNRTDITEHTVYWLDNANEYTFQVRAENALGGGLSASVKARPGKPAVSRPTFTIENVTGEDNVIAGKRDATRPVQQGSLVNGVFVGNGTYHDSCHEDAFAHYRIRATGGDHLWRPGSRFRGVSVGVEYRRAGRNGERSSVGVSSSVTGLVGRNAGAIVPGGNRHWDQKTCRATQGADRRALIIRLVPGEGYDVGRPRAICIRVDHEDNGTVVTGTPCPNVLEENAVDPLPVMAVSDASANEANGSIGFLVSLDKPAAGRVTVDYRTENVTATAPGDYTQTSGTLTFDPGETQKMVTVPIIDDTVPDNGETFKLVLSNVSGAKLADAEAVGTILNTETPILTGFTLVNAETGSDVGAIDDGGVLTLDDPANGSYGLVAAVASDAGVGSVRLALTGAKTVTATDDAAPWSLYGGANGQVQGEGLPAGSYTLSATAYAEAGGGGAELGTLSVSFSVAASEAVAPDALTASFEGVPEAHGGPGAEAFTFRVRFSLEPRVSYKVLRDESFTVTGGAVRKARRVDGRNDLREIHVEPDGWDDVSLVLPGGRACGTTGAICTADNKVLANTAVATVPGPLALSVADARIDEAPNAVLAFQVTLNRAAAGTVTVGYATADGTATAGADYTAASGTLTFDPGETAKTANVPVLDDVHDDDEETLTLTLSNATGARIRDAEATGTIENSDPIPQAWLARFGRTVSGQVLDAIEERLRASRMAGVSVRLAGQTLGLTADPDAKPDTGAEAEKESQERLGVLSDWLRHETEDRERAGIQSRTLTAPEVLMGSSFALAAKTDSGGSAAVWGRMAQSRFAGREAGLSLDGDVTTGLLGADYAQGPWTGGAVLSHSSGEGGYSGDATGKVEASMTALTPWAGYKVTERLSVWGALGYGTGDLTLTPKNPQTQKDQPAQKTDIAMTLAAAGVRGTLLEGDGPKLDAVADARWARTTSDKVTASAENGGNLGATQADVTRVRLGLEGSWAVALDDEGAAVTPRLSFGVRHDGGDAETGFGADIGGGVTLALPASGLSVSLEGRGLLTHEAKGLSDTGFGGTIAWDPAPSSNRGLSLTLRQSFGGSATGGKAALFSREAMDGLAVNGNGGGNRRLEGRIGYGLPVFGDRFTGTPEIGFGLSDDGRDYSLGWRLTREGRDAGSFEFALEATRRESANDNTPEHGIGLRLGGRLTREGRDAGSSEFSLEAEWRESANDNDPELGIGFQLTARW